jgi:glyoxylase-like metal-dependent hydrolase (beta-lactamase superfamily II)
MRILYFALLATFTSASLSAENAAEVGKNVYVVYGGDGKGSNVGVVRDGESIILIDTMLEGSRDHLLKGLSSLKDLAVSMVLNTHDHFDHVGNNRFFAESGAVIVGSKHADYEDGRRTLKTEGNLTFTGNEVVIDAHAINSHSSSDILIYIRGADVLFLGDIYADEWYPSFFSGGLKGQLDAINLALSIGTSDTRYIPGHGKPVNGDQLKKYAALCEAWVKRIASLNERGISTKDMIKDAELLKLREGFSGASTNRENFDRWFEQILTNTLGKL